MPNSPLSELSKRPDYSRSRKTSDFGEIFSRRHVPYKLKYRSIENRWDHKFRGVSVEQYEPSASQNLISSFAFGTVGYAKAFRSFSNAFNIPKAVSAKNLGLGLENRNAVFWHSLEKRVANFTKLEKGWDSYNAQPPSQIAVKNTLAFLQLLKMLGLKPDWVEPTSDDSIMLEVKVGGLLQEWDFYSDGDVAVLYELENRQDECHLVKPEVWEFARFLTTLPHAAKR